MTQLEALRVKIFADGADLEGLRLVAGEPLVRGFTTNPTLMRRAGIPDYEEFAREAVRIVGERPISFEVFADDFDEMYEQALEIAGWGSSVFVKIPITDTSGRSSAVVLRQLAARGVQVNVTAVMTLDQVAEAATALQDAPSAIVSVFAGRYADTGRDPIPLMAEAVRLLAPHPRIELLWASPRELLNVFHAEAVGCHIITVTNDVLAKLPLIGKDPLEYSLETVRMFHGDAQRAGYRIRTRAAADRR